MHIELKSGFEVGIRQTTDKTFTMGLFHEIIVDLRLAVRSEMSQRDRQKCCCDYRSDILIGIIHRAYCFAFQLYVYANMLIFVPMLPPSLQILCLSLILSLCLSFPLSPSHIKMHGNLFCLSLIAIKLPDKHRCFT